MDWRGSLFIIVRVRCYGKDLPPIVVERLERELNSIISNGYAVNASHRPEVGMEIQRRRLSGWIERFGLVHRLSQRCRGITEINTITGTLLSSRCHFVDFDSEEVKAFFQATLPVICRIVSARNVARC